MEEKRGILSYPSQLQDAVKAVGYYGETALRDQTPLEPRHLSTKTKKEYCLR
jgi:hypothetical protein